MILKKPYAFLIKHFKLIHVIMVGLLLFLIYKTNLILNFLNNYMSSKELVTGRELVEPLFSVSIYISVGIIIVMSIAIFILMTVKKKPVLFYFINVITCIGLIAIYTFAQSVIGTMETKVVSLQMIRLVRDLLTIAILLQTSSLVVNFIRSIGFNVKKFKFEDDYSELNIDVNDDEEFELELNVDTNKFKRNIRKKIRHFKYAYAEHKFIINLLGLLALLILMFIISFVLGLFEKKYDEKDLFTTNQYIMGIEDSYLVTKNYKGDMIKPGSKFVVLKLNVKNRFQSDNKFVAASSYLIIDDQKFYHQRQYNSKFTDLGVSYNDQILTNEFKEYLLVYELPINYEMKKTKFTFQDTGFKTTYDVKLKLKDLESDKKVKDYNLGDNIIIKDIVKTDILISNYEMAKNFRLNYEFCVNQKECYNSVEYLYPTLSGRTDKGLLKLTGSINLENNHINSIKNLGDFVNYFGVIEYEQNGQIKYLKNGLKEVLPSIANSNDYYIEISKEILSSNKIYLDFVIRNNVYRYKLK